MKKVLPVATEAEAVSDWQEVTHSKSPKPEAQKQQSWWDSIVAVVSIPVEAYQKAQKDAHDREIEEWALESKRKLTIQDRKRELENAKRRIIEEINRILNKKEIKILFNAKAKLDRKALQEILNTRELDKSKEEEIKDLLEISTYKMSSNETWIYAILKEVQDSGSIGTKQLGQLRELLKIAMSIPDEVILEGIKTALGWKV